MTEGGGAVDDLLRVDEFDYELPPELIAQVPLAERAASRLLVLDRSSGRVSHSSMRDIGCWLRSGDLLVANNSRVIRARLAGRRADTGGRVELLLLRREANGLWSALARPARRLRPGTPIAIEPRSGRTAAPLVAKVVERRSAGEVAISLDPDSEAALADHGSMPLPPYISVPLKDDERYQTVYASAPGSAAAPTAGLHFTDELIGHLRDAGINWTEVTLHVGLDTFRPVTVERVADHPIHQEWCSVSGDVAEQIVETKREGNRVVAVGTTAARTLETFGSRPEREWSTGFSGMTSLFITPGYRWRMTDALLTNFHLPRSTLLMLVSSFANSELIRTSYQEAMAERYRFYSFGDAMLIL